VQKVQSKPAISFVRLPIFPVIGGITGVLMWRTACDPLGCAQVKSVESDIRQLDKTGLSYLFDFISSGILPAKKEEL
jgi:hypothetical protein